MRFVKRPVEIDAYPVSMLIDQASNHWDDLPPWVIRAYNEGKIIFLNRAIEIGTLEGRMTANFDDWLILGIKGELYPCKPDVFELTYQRVGTQSSTPKRNISALEELANLEWDKIIKCCECDASVQRRNLYERRTTKGNTYTCVTCFNNKLLVKKKSQSDNECG